MLICVAFCKTSVAQKLSTVEFLNLENLSLKSIDSLMQKRNFSRWDTSANEITFRFYGYSALNETRYLQLGINADNVYTEFQYQTSVQKEALQMQQQLLQENFMQSFKTSSEKSFHKNNTVIIFSQEHVDGSGVILYTFILSAIKKKEIKNMYKLG